MVRPSRDNGEEKGKLRQLLQYWPMAVIGVVFIAATAGLVMFIGSMMNSEIPPPKQAAYEVKVIRPPPPPPQEEEPPPPPEMEQEEVDVPEDEAPEPMPDELDGPPPGDLLGLDADGVAGADGFGLAARRGGRGLLDGGGGGYRMYGRSLESSLIDCLSEDDELRKSRYSTNLNLWLGSDGSIRRSELQGSTGDPALDSKLRDALGNGGCRAPAPPAGMPQPVRLRLSSRV